MKLHLPKTLLVAVLAACVAPTWAGQWVANTDGVEDCYTFTGTDDVTSLDTTGHIGGNGVWVRAGAADITATLTELMLVNGEKLNITGSWGNNTNKFTLLTISDLKIGADGTGAGFLEIANNVNATTDIPLQTVALQKVTGTLNGISVLKNGKLITTSDILRDKVANGTVISIDGGTLELTRKDDKDVNKSITVSNKGTLTLGSTDIVDESATTTFTINNSTMAVGANRIALGANNKIVLNNASVTGDGDVHGALDYSGSATLQSTGNSSIAGAIRLRAVNLTLDVSSEEGSDTIGTLTVANIVQADNTTGGIIKDGDGTLIIKALQAKGNNSSSKSVYKGNTEIKAGAIMYDLSANASYAGTVFGSGNIIKDGTAELTLAKVQRLDGDITVSNGKLTITELDAGKTLDVSVAQGATLSLGSVTVDALTHQLTEVDGIDSKVWFTNDGTTESADGNGFRVEEASYVLFKGYAWDGTVSGYTVDSSSGDTILTTPGTAGTVYYVNSGEFRVDGSTTNYAKDATGYHVNTNSTLKITNDQSDSMTAGAILLSAVGEGNITLAKDASVNATSGSIASYATGKLTIQNATLTMGDHKDDTMSLASFSSVDLDNATIAYQGAATTFNDVTVTTNGANLNISDMKGDTWDACNTMTLAGTTTLKGKLAITSTEWKYKVNIEALTGAGDLNIESSTTRDANSQVTIGSLQGYTGAISVTKNTGGTILNATTGGAVTLKGLTLAGGATGAVRTTGNVGLGNVSLTDGAYLEILNEGSTRTTTISSLSITGNATLSTARHSSCFNGTFEISSLSNAGDSAVLTLKNGSQIDTATVFNLSGNSSMEGTINVQSDSYRGDNNDDANKNNAARKLQLNLNSKEVASKAVINFQDASNTTGKNGAGSANNVRANYNILGVGIDGAKVAGLSGETTNAATIKSTSDDARALEIVATSNYSTNANVETGVNLIKSGTGTQTISGSIGSTDIAVNGGELALTGTEELSLLNLTVKAGATMSVGANGAGTVVVAAPVSTFNTTGSTTDGVVALEGGSTITGGLDLSNATTLQLDKMTGTDLITVTGNLTLPEGTLTLSGDVLTKMAALVGGATLDIFSVGGAFNYAGQDVTSSFTMANGPTLDNVFANGTSDYYLGYTMADGAAGGTVYIGKVIPEPTTATLSLLALAALAARRRRK